MNKLIYIKCIYLLVDHFIMWLRLYRFSVLKHFSSKDVQAIFLILWTSCWPYIKKIKQNFKKRLWPKFATLMNTWWQSQKWLRKILQHSWKNKQHEQLTEYMFGTKRHQILWILLYNKDLLVWHSENEYSLKTVLRPKPGSDTLSCCVTLEELCSLYEY